MKHIARTVLLATLVLGLAAAASAKDHRACSNASLSGEWGYTETGTVIAPTGAVSAVAVGKYTFDDAGNFGGTQHSSAGGTVSEDTKLGTYTVNPDCTGTLTLRVYDQSGTWLRESVWAIVLVDDATEYRGIMISMVLPTGMELKPVLTLEARRLFRNRGVVK